MDLEYLFSADADNFPSVQGCVVELEGKKRGKYWTFSIVDPSGLNLVRMSSENQAESEKWIKVGGIYRE